MPFFSYLDTVDFNNILHSGAAQNALTEEGAHRVREQGHDVDAHQRQDRRALVQSGELRRFLFFVQVHSPSHAFDEAHSHDAGVRIGF